MKLKILGTILKLINFNSIAIAFRVFATSWQSSKIIIASSEKLTPVQTIVPGIILARLHGAIIVNTEL